MRTRRPTLFVTFPETASAMEAERLVREACLPGRLVPVPREITAGCGLAWMSEPEAEPELRAFFDAAGVRYEGCTVLSFSR